MPLRSFANVSTDKIAKLIRSGNSKTCSLDPMPTSFIKVLLPVLLPTIHKIVNQSLDQSYMPCTLREAIVMPLIKKPSLDKENFKNYRPVSNLAYLGKLIESVVIGEIEDHLSKNNFLSPSSQRTLEIIAQRLLWSRSLMIYYVPLTAGSVSTWSSWILARHLILLTIKCFCRCCRRTMG